MSEVGERETTAECRLVGQLTVRQSVQIERIILHANRKTLPLGDCESIGTTPTVNASGGTLRRYARCVTEELVLSHYLIAESELPDERAARRERAGKSAGETYAATLLQMVPDATVTVIAPADDDARTYALDELAVFDAVFLTGSPMHVYRQTPEVERVLAFMRAVFASGVPSFGSCAGLQIAVAAAGGRVRKMPERMEAGVARRITATEAGRNHPMLAGRASAWDAAAIHGDEVEELPPESSVLASNAVTRVQAAEINFDGGTFWGVQYHPELSLAEIASALRSQATDLVGAGLADEETDVQHHAALLDGLHADPKHRPIRWALGVDDELAKEVNRRREIANFLAFLAKSDPE